MENIEMATCVKRRGESGDENSISRGGIISKRRKLATAKAKK